MTSRIGEIVIDCRDRADEAAAFWCAALGYRELARDGTGVAIGGDPRAPTILLVRSPDSKRDKASVHLDVCPTDRDQAAEVDRLLALGARHADIGQGDTPWVVLADPVGTEFCVLPIVLPPEPEPF
ncbi:VOC family protein, partial [Actinocatenispora rupis]